MKSSLKGLFFFCVKMAKYNEVVKATDSYFNMLDKLVDNSDGEDSGRVKLNVGAMKSLYYKGIPRKRLK